MDDMTHVISLRIPIHDSLLCLSYSSIFVKLKENFPSIESVEKWTEKGEYKRLEDFVCSQDLDSERGETMLRQLRTKQISNGPSFRLSMDASDGDPNIDVSHFRWGITFRRSVPFSQTDTDSIRIFLTSIGVGTVESYTQE